MPSRTSAKKTLKQNKKKNLLNRTRMSALRTQVKKFTALVETKDVTEVETNLPLTVKLIDKAVAKGLIKKNTAARRKSKFMKSLNNVKAGK